MLSSIKKPKFKLNLSIEKTSKLLFKMFFSGAIKYKILKIKKDIKLTIVQPWFKTFLLTKDRFNLENKRYKPKNKGKKIATKLKLPKILISIVISYIVFNFLAIKYFI